MRLIDRYILSEFLRCFLLSLLALITLVFIAEHIKGVWDAEAAVNLILQYNSYNLPMVFCQMVPPAAMLGTAMTLSLLNRKSELTAIQASGIGLGHISVLIFGVIFTAACLTLVIHDRVVPAFAHKRTLFYWRVLKNRPDFSLDIKTSKIWYRSKNYIYNLKNYDTTTSTIRGIGIYFFDDQFQLIQHVTAETANFDNEKLAWYLKNGMLTIFPDNNPFPLSKHFEEKRLTLPETPKDFLEIERQVDTLRLKDLKVFITRNKEAGLNMSSYEVDFHSRLASAFIPLIMSLLAIPYSIRPKRQGGLARDLAVCVSWIFSYWLLYSLSLSLGRAGTIVPWISVWAPSVLFLGIATTLIWKGKVA